MVDLPFSTNACPRYDLHEAVDGIADHGYAGVEILGDRPRASFPEFGGSDRRALAEALDLIDDVGYDGFATMELYTFPDEPERAARDPRDALDRV